MEEDIVPMAGQSREKPTTKRFDAHPARPLRITAAVNFAKSMMLGEKHRPGDPQLNEVRSSLDGATNCNKLLGDVTWNSWFEPTPPEVKESKIRILDIALASDTDSLIKRGVNRTTAGRGFVSEMALGGLVSTIVEACPSKRSELTIEDRARKYQPLSPIHLLLDAIDVNAFTGRTMNSEWKVIKRVAAARVLQIIHDKWNGRDGSVYSQFRSSFRISWDAATLEEREAISARMARFKPNPLERQLKHGAWPRRELLDHFGISAATDSPRILFDLARDSDFLVEDRFEAWAVDLAIALLSITAFGYADRYRTFGSVATVEETWWTKGARALLFGEEPSVSDLIFEFGPLGPADGDDEGVTALEKLIEARRNFHCLLAKLNLYPSQVQAIVSRQWEERPVRIFG